MGKKRDIRGKGGKDGIEFAAAAIVDDNQIVFSFIMQTMHQLQQALIRLIGGNQEYSNAQASFLFYCLLGAFREIQDIRKAAGRIPAGNIILDLPVINHDGGLAAVEVIGLCAAQILEDLLQLNEAHAAVFIRPAIHDHQLKVPGSTIPMAERGLKVCTWLSE